MSFILNQGKKVIPDIFFAIVFNLKLIKLILIIMKKAQEVIEFNLRLIFSFKIYKGQLQVLFSK